MHIRFLEVAQKELDENVEYYNQESPGLGKRFLNQVLEALDRIGNFPQAWQKCTKRTRRCQLQYFPYGIIYQIRGNEILVVAVANLHREPDYWKDRL